MPPRKASTNAADKPEAQTRAKTASETKPPAATKAAPAKRKPASKSGDPALYTKPELREKLKKEITDGDKGGRPGQWSARKAQLLASEYEKAGGDYKKSERTDKQKHLESWTEEKWQTADGKEAERGETTARYLPKEAWEKLTPAQRKATDEKKKATSGKSQQFVANTPAAKRARKDAQKS